MVLFTPFSCFSRAENTNTVAYKLMALYMLPECRLVIVS